MTQSPLASSFIPPLRMPDADEFRFVQQFEQRVLPYLRRSTVPILEVRLDSLGLVGPVYIVNSPPISAVATGTLVKESDEHFIVTAEHVVTGFLNEGKQLRIGIGSPQWPQVINVSDRFVRTDAKLDVAVIKLEKSVVAQLVDPFFLLKKHIDFVDRLEDATYLLPGYLWDGSGPNPGFSQFVFRNYDYWTRPYYGSI